MHFAFQGLIRLLAAVVITSNNSLTEPDRMFLLPFGVKASARVF